MMRRTLHNAITDVPGIKVGHATDLEALNGPVRNALHAEIAHCPDGFFTKPENAFGGSEYVKDGLVAIVEATGKDEWFERMMVDYRRARAGNLATK